MIIDNLTSTCVYIDVKTQTSIYVNKYKNNLGVLEFDEFGNQLMSEIDSGYTPLDRLIKYTGDNYLMLHNPSSGSLELLKEGDKIDIDCDFSKGLRYYINSEIIRNKDRIGNKFQVNLEGRNIFRVLLGGREVKNYTYDSKGVNIVGADIYLLDAFSEIIIYTYEDVEITSIENIIEITYKQYKRIDVWGDKSDPNFLEYLEGEDLLEVRNFDSASITPNVSKTNVTTPFKGTTNVILNNIDNLLSLDIFLVEGDMAIPHFVGTEEFRVIFSNPTFGRVVLVNNCLLDSSESLVFSKERNKINMTIGCGNYIDIKYLDGNNFGMGAFSQGAFGKTSVIKNSHRG